MADSQTKVGASVCFTERECEQFDWNFEAIAQEARRRSLPNIRGSVPAWVSARRDKRMGLQVWLGDQANGARS